MRHNFTLFELLLIVGVIAIAAAMMHPMFSAARDAAAEAGCRSNLSLFSKAATSYSNDNDNWAITGYLGAQTGNWFHVFERSYGINKDAFHCPADANYSFSSKGLNYGLNVLTFGETFNNNQKKVPHKVDEISKFGRNDKLIMFIDTPPVCAGYNGKTDIFCPMYYNYDNCRAYCEDNSKTKPLIQCEYAHAMGNSMGGFKEYWDLVRKYPKYQGGFIWDFVDQSIHKTGKNGRLIYAYGGDFNRFDASDINFCNNGLISPDRVPNPHAYEVRYFYQDIWTTPADLKQGKVNIYNENFFRDLSAYYLEWQVLKNGRVMRSGRIDNIDVAPQQTATIQLPIGATCTCAEWLLNVSYKLKANEGLLPAGYTVARDQLVLNPYKQPALTLENQAGSNETIILPVIRDNDTHYLIVTGEAFRIEFNKETGFLSLYEADGLSYLKEGSVLKPNFWRAPTDNDFGANLQNRYRVWLNPELKLTAFNQRMDNGQAVVEASYDIPAVNGKLALTYVINNRGAIKVTQQMTAGKGGEVSDLFRFGMQLQMPRSFETIEYYGRGPVENYADRNHNTFLGRYRQSVARQFYPYVRPQENGNKTDLRWWRVLNIGGNGLEIVAEAPFSASALHYTIESLDEGPRKIQRHSNEVEPADLTNVLIDKAQMGLGCIDSWGALPLPEYRLPYQDYSFTFTLTPVQHCLGTEQDDCAKL